MQLFQVGMRLRNVFAIKDVVHYAIKKQDANVTKDKTKR